VSTAIHELGETLPAEELDKGSAANFAFSLKPAGTNENVHPEAIFIDCGTPAIAAPSAAVACYGLRVARIGRAAA